MKLDEVDQQLEQKLKEIEELKKQKAELKDNEKQKALLLGECLSELRTEGAKLRDSDKSTEENLRALKAITEKYVQKCLSLTPVEDMELEDVPDVDDIDLEEPEEKAPEETKKVKSK